MTKKTAAIVITFFAVILALMIVLVPIQRKNEFKAKWGKLAELAETDERARFIIENEELYPKEILDIYYNDRDEFEYVYNYAFHKNDYSTMKFTEEELNCKTVPALYMSDYRWSYEDNRIVKNDGCAAVSITMANLFLNHDSSIDPVSVMRYAYKMGYDGFWGGIDAEKMPQLLTDLGFSYIQHENDDNFTETDLKELLNKDGTVLLAAMRGEIFGGHALIIHGFGQNGFLLNDPASPVKTGMEWDFETLNSELVYIWELV